MKANSTESDPLDRVALLANVPLDFEPVLGTRTMALKEILDLEPGCLVPLTRSVGENVDIYVNGALIGFGEIMVLENSLAVRVTDFLGEG